MELLVVVAGVIHAALPLEHGGLFDFLGINLHEEGPDDFAVDEVVEAAGSASIEQFGEVLLVVLGLDRGDGYFLKYLFDIFTHTLIANIYFNCI